MLLMLRATEAFLKSQFRHREPGMNYICCNLCGADDYTVLFPAGIAQEN